MDTGSRNTTTFFFFFLFSIFSLFCCQKQNLEDRKSLQHFYEALWGWGKLEMNYSFIFSVGKQNRKYTEVKL